MATERLPMRKIRDILRLKWTLQRSHRETARSVGVSAGSVASVVCLARANGLTAETVGALSDAELVTGVNHSFHSHCLAKFATRRESLPHIVCYRRRHDVGDQCRDAAGAG